MSRTIRNILRLNKNNSLEIGGVDDTRAKWQRVRTHKSHKLHPYVTDKDLNVEKYKPYSYNHGNRRTGLGARVSVNNANRSMRKAVRQEVKIDIRKQLETE